MRRRIWALLLAVGAATMAVRAQEPPALSAAEVLLLSNGPGDAAAPALRTASSSRFDPIRMCGRCVVI